MSIADRDETLGNITINNVYKSPKELETEILDDTKTSGPQSWYVYIYIILYIYKI